MHIAYLKNCLRGSLIIPILLISVFPIINVGAVERVSSGWLVSVGGKAIATPAFPGWERYSFINFPALSVETPNLADHLTGKDDSLSLVLFSPNPSLSIGAIGRYDPNRGAFNNFDTFDTRWSVEPGVFAEYWASPDSLRIRGELRAGADGAGGLTGNLGAAFVKRIGKFVISAGPHLEMSGIDYVGARYGLVNTQHLPGDQIGSRSFGAAGLVNFISGRNWSTSLYANYDRVELSGVDSQKSQIGGFNDEVRVGASFNLNFTPPSQ